MVDEPPSDPLGEAGRAIARRLIDEINRFNLATTGLDEVYEILRFETDRTDELTGGVYGWCWGKPAGLTRCGCAKIGVGEGSALGCWMRLRPRPEIAAVTS